MEVFLRAAAVVENPRNLRGAAVVEDPRKIYYFWYPSQIEIVCKSSIEVKGLVRIRI